MPEHQNQHDMLPLSEQKEFLLNSLPVSVLTGSEFAKKDGVTLTQQVTEYYNSIGNMAISPVYGEIILDKQSVEDDFAHGVGRKKAIAFAAVPDVIEKGIIILPLYVHEVSLKQKLLDDSSNPALIPAAYQGVESCPTTDCAKTINQGNVAKILQKIISAK